MGRTVQMMSGLMIFYAGLGATLAFGLFAFVGMPLIAIGLGLFSAAIDA